MKARWLALLAAPPAAGAALLFVVAPMMMVGAMGSATTSGGDGGSTCTKPPLAVAAAELDADQKQNAATIIATGQRLKVPHRGLIISIATAMQESTLHNLSGGDLDSVGLFQQRNAWGSFAERTDPAQAATMFFTGGHAGQPGLLDIQGWPLMSITRAAQAVQRSAYPDAYAKWEPLARSVVGAAPEEVPCEPEPAIGGPCTGPKDLSHFPNGQIPDTALCPLPWAKGHQLRSDAANAAIKMNAAYKAHFGTDICVTDSYRTLSEQVDLRRRKPDLAAVPGTSNHGWGIALDLGCGLQVAGSPQDVWMHQHEGEFGWEHPSWAEPSGSKPEPWHHEYTG